MNLKTLYLHWISELSVKEKFRFFLFYFFVFKSFLSGAQLCTTALDASLRFTVGTVATPASRSSHTGCRSKDYCFSELLLSTVLKHKSVLSSQRAYIIESFFLPSLSLSSWLTHPDFPTLLPFQNAALVCSFLSCSPAKRHRGCTAVKGQPLELPKQRSRTMNPEYES